MIASAIRHGKKRRNHEKQAAALKRAVSNRDTQVITYGAWVEYDPRIGYPMFGPTIYYAHGKKDQLSNLCPPLTELGSFDQKRKSGDNA